MEVTFADYCIMVYPFYKCSFKPAEGNFIT